MDLKINIINGLIGMNISQGKMNIDYGKSNFHMQTKNPKINMEITQPKVNIDQTKPLGEIGLKKITDFIKTNVEKGKQVCLQGISRIVQQGNELAMIEAGNTAIPRQSEYNAFDQYKKEVNVDFIPKSRPEISLEEGTVKINFKKGEVNIENKPQEVNLDYTLGKVEIYLKQKPFIDIEYIGNKLDIKI
ncbi:DUF6470 family protein [Paramaledivibacter caminithermalis]|uniref:Uncharacterized protein n=1 Tax=Paramaledivibacter caminithermalis (strain DSM 15212 / CIP 107654 / DViRD3) TaxID=1121301 RepID=A0A1M6L5P2_PARC5|nr:DUF6470 family protein [Paramaledivibacter caminithermalis]SHJ66512.1 hypothetical protein SAMN02745912_00668 [Paramaledivibacter caminithermalis DSM 15212]